MKNDPDRLLTVSQRLDQDAAVQPDFVPRKKIGPQSWCARTIPIRDRF